MNYERKLKKLTLFTLLLLTCSFTGLKAQCEIGDIIVEAYDCDPNNFFLVDLDFNYANTSDSFNVAGNGTNYGNFAYSDLFITLGPLEDNGTIYEFVVTDLDNPNCSAFALLNPPDCNTPPCEITNLNALALECNNDGTFSVEINFDYENPPNQFFDVFGANGDILGTFLLANLPVVLPNFEGGGGAYDYLQVCINDAPYCCAETEFNSLDCPGQCALTNFTYEISPCNDQGFFFITINFNWEYTGTTFSIIGNGNDYGEFSYSQVPVTLGPFPGDDGTAWEFGVFDTEHPNCGEWLEVGEVNCNPPCEIWDLIVEAHPCDDQGMFLVDLDFNFANTSDSFMVVGNGNNYGTWAYTDLWITFGPLDGNGNNYEFIVIDQEYPDCSAEYILESENCNGGNCQIFNPAAETGDCNDDGTYPLWINFEVENPGNAYFDLFASNGDFIGYYGLNELPLQITYGPSNSSTDFVVACINDNPNCCVTIQFVTPECGGNNCEIWDLIVEPYACDDQGMFMVDLAFNYANTSDSFMVVGNGINYGTWAYSDLYITFGPFEGNGSVYEFVVIDLEQPDCAAEIAIYSEDCLGGECEIFDLVVEVGDCNDNGIYPLWINFEVENPNNDFFELFDSNGDFIGWYPLSDLPLQIEYGPSNANIDWITVCINDNPNCCETIEFETPNCGGGNCEIWDLIVEAYACDDQGMFLVDLDFNYANTSDSFMVVGNGNNYGTWAYSDLYITFGPFEGNGSVYEFVVIDLEQLDCAAEIAIYSEDCLGGECEIFDLVVETGDCNDDGTYPLWINFEVENPGNDFFELFDSNGDFIGWYPLSDLPLQIVYGPSNGDIDWITVCINDNPNCCETIEFETPNCGGNCEIWDLIVEPYDCDDQGMFLIDLDFNYANTSDSFYVMGNGVNYGTFAYSDLYITLGPLDGDGVTNYNFVVMDQENPDCVAATYLGVVDCGNNNNCSISDIEVYTLDCNPDGTYNLIVLFDYDNVATNNFDVYSGNVYVGTYPYNGNLPTTITSFPGSGNDYDLITICDSDSETCCESLEFEAPDCEACEIYDMVAEPTACNDQDEFYVILDFEHNGPPGLGFLVFGNGTTYGNFDYDELPLTLGPLDGDGVTVYEFIAVDIIDNSCLGYVELGTVTCMIPPPVWPGDIDFDNQANNLDLLNMGVAFGAEGPERPDTGIDWLAWESDPWNQSFANGTNFKHADCNGDGVVDMEDLQAIELNYNETHGDVLPFEETPSTPNDPALFIDLPTIDQIQIGEVFTAPIILGEMDLPVEDIYGLAFTIEFDPEMMDEAGVYVEIGNSWLGEQNTQLINVNKNFADQGRIDVAISRTDHTNVTGYGQISYFIGIIDDIAGKTELEINITNVRAIQYNEERIPLNAPPSIIDLTTSEFVIADDDIDLFPNPASEQFFVRNESQFDIDQIRVYNTLGQLMTEKVPTERLTAIAADEWSSGIYFVEFLINGERITKKLKITTK